MPKINKRSPVHILPNQNGRHLPPLTPPPRPVYPRRRPTQQPPASTSSTTELSTTQSTGDNSTTTLDYEVSQGNARLDTILMKKNFNNAINCNYYALLHWGISTNFCGCCEVKKNRKYRY